MEGLINNNNIHVIYNYYKSFYTIILNLTNFFVFLFSIVGDIFQKSN